MNDYANFLMENPRYEKALANSSDAESFLQELQNAGYATDPAYANKISNIMKRESFMQIVADLKLDDNFRENNFRF